MLPKPQFLFVKQVVLLNLVFSNPPRPPKKKHRTHIFFLPLTVITDVAAKPATDADAQRGHIAAPLAAATAGVNVTDVAIIARKCETQP